MSSFEAFAPVGCDHNSSTVFISVPNLEAI